MTDLPSGRSVIPSLPRDLQIIENSGDSSTSLVTMADNMDPRELKDGCDRKRA